MKVKFPNTYRRYIGTKMYRYLAHAIEENPNLEVVGVNDYSDIAIDINTNTKKSIILDYADPHGVIPDFNVDAIACEKRIKAALKTHNITIDQITPSIVWAERKNNTPYIDKVETYDIYATKFLNDVYREFIAKLKRPKHVVIPHGLPIEIFNYGKEKTIDVFMKGASSRWYPFRRKFYNTIQKRDNVFISHLSGASFKKYHKTTEQWDTQLAEYANELKASKIILTDSSIFKYPVKKYIEAMACGCLVLADIPDYAEELGYIDGETMVEVNLDNFEEKVDYYLRNEKERKRITDNAYTLYLENYTCDKIVGKILNI